MSRPASSPTLRGWCNMRLIECMSKETVREFFQVAENDEALQEMIKAANSSMNVVQIAAEKGYEFTELELQAVMQKAVAEDGDLSEEELDAVAGGMVAPSGGVRCKGSYAPH